MDLSQYLCGMGSSQRQPQDKLSTKLSKNLSGFRKKSKLRTDGSVNALRKHLPQPTGPHTIGCLDLMTERGKNGIFTRIFYPTNSCDIMERQATWPLWLPHKQYGKGYAWFRRQNLRFFGYVYNKVGAEIYIPAIWNAPLLETEGQYPVVVLTHGLGGNRTVYTALSSELASHGFIVLAAEHRDGTASMTYCLEEDASTDSTRDLPSSLLPDTENSTEKWLPYERQVDEEDFDIRNKQIYGRIDELKRYCDVLEKLNAGGKVDNHLSKDFDLSQFKNKLDLSKLALWGHSFGASAAVAALGLEKRFKLALVCDIWMLPMVESMYDSITQPILCINADTFHWKENLIEMFKMGLNVNEEETRRYLITLIGACHQSFSDFQFLLPKKISQTLFIRDDLKPSVVMKLITQACMGFIRRELDVPGPQYEEVLLAQCDHVIRGTDKNISTLTVKTKET